MIIDVGSNPDHHADCPIENLPHLTKLWADLEEVFRIALHTRNNRLNFGDDLDHHADSPNRKSKQYGGNELPWPRRSALSVVLWLS